MPRTRSLLAPAALCAALALPLSGQQPAPHIESIRADQLRADLFFLAGDGMEGRLTGTRGNSMAADWILSRFQRLGLAAPGGSYRQEYNLMTASLGPSNALTARVPGGALLQPVPGQAFHPHRFSANGAAAGPLVFVGYGMTSPAQGHDDYRGDRIRGSVVLAMDHEPGEGDPDSPFDGLVTSHLSSSLEKTLAAQARGAVGILFVSDVHNHEGPVNFEGQARNYWPSEPPLIERFTLSDWSDRVRIPAMQISPALAEQLLASSGKTLAELGREAEAARGGASPAVVTGTTVELTASVVHHVVPDQNIVALVEGSDPALKDEWIIISAHIDHNGRDALRVYNGADDDGSGIVALLEIAEAYALAAEAGQRPRRSVLFAAWNSEERGLLGAWAYTERPLHPLARTVAVLNMDMVGRNEEVRVGGGGRFRGLEVQTAESNANAVNVLGYSRAPDLWTAVQQANGGIGLELKNRYDNNASNLLRRSDQWPFLQRGVPAVWFHTGLHPDYHTEFDLPEKINYEKMEKIARLVYQTSWELAQQQGRPRAATSQGG